MKDKIYLSLILLIAILSSCASPPAPTPTLISTPLPTATPTPEPISGIIFWDANGSGLMDETSFIIPDFDPSAPPYFFELLAANGTGLGNLSPGELATVPEPPIPGIGICLGDVCTETDESGTFTLQPEKTQETYSLKFNDPNADDPARAFRYINQWNGSVVIESYEMDGVIVPEQHLNDTKVIEISNVSTFPNENENSYGLLQGPLVYPFPITKSVYVSSWFDINPNQGELENWTSAKSKNSFYDNNLKILDNHFAIDWLIPENIYFLAPLEGKIIEVSSDPDPYATQYDGLLTIDHVDARIFTHYGHLNLLTLSKDLGDIVYRGQFISYTNKAASGPGDFPFPNMLHAQIQNCRNCKFPIDQSQRFDFYLSQENNSYWTVVNIPQFPLVEIIE